MMFQVFTDKSASTAPRVDEMILSLQDFKQQLSLSHACSSRMVIQEVNDCISDLEIEAPSPLSTSLNLSWFIREVEALLKHYQLTLDSLEEET